MSVGSFTNVQCEWSVKYRTIHTGTSSHSNPHPSPSFLTLAKSFIDTYIGYVSLFTCTSTTESGFAPSSDSVNVVVMHACVRACVVLSPDWCRPKISPRPFGNLERDEDGLFDACSVLLLLLTTPSSARVEIGFATRAKSIWPIKTTVSVGLGLGLVRTKLAISSLHTPRKQMQCLLIGIMRWLKWMKYEGGGGRAWITTFNWRGKRFFYSFACLITSSFFFECFRDSIISSLWNFVIFFHSLDGS